MADAAGGLDKWWANFANNGYPSITPWYCVSAEFVGALHRLRNRRTYVPGRKISSAFDAD